MDYDYYCIRYREIYDSPLSPNICNYCHYYCRCSDCKIGNKPNYTCKSINFMKIV